MKKIVINFFGLMLLLGCSNTAKDNLTKPDISEAKDAFCYLKAEGVQMFAHPDQGSTQLWTFSKGEVLAVLDSKMEANKSWLQVKFTGNVKAGYEEFLEINSQPNISTGWIAGTVDQLVSCK